MTPKAPKVFVSYSHDSPEHADRVLALSNKFRQHGVDCVLDQFEEFGPPERWSCWVDKQIRDADFVLMVCTQTYYNRVMSKEKLGARKEVRFEGTLIYQYICDAASEHARFVPVLFSDGSEEHIPVPVRGGMCYRWDADADYLDIYHRITGQRGGKKADPGPS